MLPLAAASLPTDPDGLAEALRGALAALFEPASAISVSAEGDSLDAVTALTVDLTGTDLPLGKDAPAVNGTPTGDGLWRVRRFALDGDPVKVAGAAVTLDADMRDLALKPGQTPQGQPVALFESLGGGTLTVSTTESALRAFATALAGHFAGGLGLRVSDVKFTLEMAGKGVVHAKLGAKVAKGFVSGPLDAVFQVMVEPSGTLTVAEAHAKAGGVLGTLASGLIHARVKPLEGKVIDLNERLPGGLRVQDLSVSQQGETFTLTGALVSG